MTEIEFIRENREKCEKFVSEHFSEFNPGDITDVVWMLRNCDFYATPGPKSLRGLSADEIFDIKRECENLRFDVEKAHS